jgi:hypothetical protein
VGKGLMKQYIGLFFFIVTITAVTLNSLLMLISPKLWFRMPMWIRLSNFPEAKFSDGWGGIQIRLLGAIFLAAIIWFAHGLVYNHR